MRETEKKGPKNPQFSHNFVKIVCPKPLTYPENGVIFSPLFSTSLVGLTDQKKHHSKNVFVVPALPLKKK